MTESHESDAPLDWVEEVVEVDVRLRVRIAAEYATPEELSKIIAEGRPLIASAVETDLRLGDRKDTVGWIDDNRPAFVDCLIDAETTVVHG